MLSDMSITTDEEQLNTSELSLSTGHSDTFVIEVPLPHARTHTHTYNPCLLCLFDPQCFVCLFVCFPFCLFVPPPFQVEDHLLKEEDIMEVILDTPLPKGTTPVARVLHVAQATSRVTTHA